MPPYGTLIIVGAANLDEASTVAVRLRTGNRHRNTDRTVAIPSITPGRVERNEPGRVQTELRGEWILPAVTAADVLNAELLDQLLQREVSAILRDRHAWSYGATTSLTPAGNSIILTMVAQVQSDREADAIGELEALLRGLPGDASAKKWDVSRLAMGVRQQLLANQATLTGLEQGIREAIRAGRDASWIAELVRATTAMEQSGLAKALGHLDPGKMRLTITRPS